MRVDLHTHTWYSPDGMMPPKKLLHLARKRGLHAVAITDHNRLTVVKSEDIIVIPGEEIKTRRGEIIGLFLSEEIPKGLSPEETFDRIREQGGIAVVPHPFDKFRAKTALLLRYDSKNLPKGTLIEVLNARYVLQRFYREAKALAEKNGFHAVGGSDAHTPVEVGRVWTEVPPFTDGEELYRHIKRGNVIPSGSFSPVWVHATVPVIKVLHLLGIIPRQLL